MNCKNCNEPLTGKKNFCSSCGQKNIAKLTFKYLVNEVVENVLNLDSKMFKTLKLLVFNPGFLAQEFSEGKRVKHVSPVRFYIITSVVFFFLVSIVRFIPNDNNEDTINASFTFNDKSINVSRDQYKKLLFDDTLDEYITDSLNIESGFSHYFVKQSIKAQNSDGSFGDVVLNQLSIFLLLFIPLISLIYKWSFVRNKFLYLYHASFNLYFNSFIIMLLIINEIIKIIAGDIYRNSNLGEIILFLISVVYLFIAIKNFYKRKWWVVLYKMLFLLIGYAALIVVFSVLLFLVSIVIS